MRLGADRARLLNDEPPTRRQPSRAGDAENPRPRQVAYTPVRTTPGSCHRCAKTQTVPTLAPLEQGRARLAPGDASEALNRDARGAHLAIGWSAGAAISERRRRAWRLS